MPETDDFFTFLEENHPDALLATGFDDCLIGVAEDRGHSRLVYDRTAILRSLMLNNSWSFDEALEFAEFNIFSAYVGPNTPLYVSFNPHPGSRPVDNDPTLN